MPNSPEYTALRQIMYQPSAVWLATENSGDRWLTDQFVLLDVSDMDEFDELPDGPYKLSVSEGPRHREGVPEPDIEAWFTRVAQCAWRSARPSEWSVAEHPGKAMLWVSGSQSMLPCLMGEPTWTAIKRHHPEVEIDYASDLNMFRFAEWSHDITQECAEGTCMCVITPFCWASGIRIPDGQEDAAWALAGIAGATSNPSVN